MVAAVGALGDVVASNAGIVMRAPVPERIRLQISVEATLHGLARWASRQTDVSAPMRAALLDLMQAYARIRTRDEFRPFVMDRDKVFTMEQALERMRPLIAFAGTWTDIAGYLPEGWEADPVRRRSATAATFAAALELVKEGHAEIRQSEIFAPIQLRRRTERP